MEGLVNIFILIIDLDYTLQMFIDLIKENGFTLKKTSRWYSVEKLTEADYADDLVLLANSPTHAESLLHSLEQAAGGITLCMNTNKTEFKCFKQAPELS